MTKSGIASQLARRTEELAAEATSVGLIRELTAQEITLVSGGAEPDNPE